MIKRDKRRYLSLKVDTEIPVDKKLILEVIQNAVLRFFGEYGASKANIKLIKYIPEKNQIIIRCSHIMVEKVRASIASIIAIKNFPATIHTENISGTLKALNKKIKLN
jgi:ribonuclease P/MRP protein subunit POP5